MRTQVVIGFLHQHALLTNTHCLRSRIELSNYCAAARCHAIRIRKTGHERAVQPQQAFPRRCACCSCRAVCICWYLRRERFGSFELFVWLTSLVSVGFSRRPVDNRDTEKTPRCKRSEL